jgi:DNA gyrase/topoisomerase IV subunit A
MKETEAKVSSEMERLAQLSEFVVHKNSEAEEKLAEAQRLSKQLTEWQGVIGSEHDAVLRLKREVEDDRMKLSRDRVTLLKNKPNLSQHPLGRSTKVNLMNDFSLTKPEDLRRRLTSVKAEMKRLSDA